MSIPPAYWSRREALELLVALGLGAGCRRAAPPAPPLAAGPGARFDSFPIARLDGFLTPPAEFFVRDHFGIPPEAAAGAGWTVEISGEVDRPGSFTLEDLSRFAALDQPVTLECAGNAGRNGLGAPGGERAWGGASTAAFQGVSLAGVLQRAGLRPSATEVVFEGADRGAERGSTLQSAFARSLPVAAALSASATLATQMNGGPLPALHGGPLRAIFPGRYATDSVKWVRRIIAMATPFQGFYQRNRYRRATPGDPVGQPLGELRVQSEIARPRPGEKLPLGLMVDVVGVAWGGHGGLARVEVSVDGGRTFAEARFLDPDRPGCWRRWMWSWSPDSAGPRLLIARATDRSGATQPFSSEEELGLGTSISGPDRIQYANNAVPIIPVRVV